MKNEPLDPYIPRLPLTMSRLDQIFPTLTKAEMDRIAAHGILRPIRSGEILVEQGDKAVPFFVVVSGEIEAVRPSGGLETPVAIFRAGQFSGEVNSLSGRRAVARLRASADGNVIQLSREHLLDLVHTDAELGEILMPAFILRRAELRAQGVGDVTLVG